MATFLWARKILPAVFLMVWMCFFMRKLQYNHLTKFKMFWNAWDKLIVSGGHLLSTTFFVVFNYINISRFESDTPRIKRQVLQMDSKALLLPLRASLYIIIIFYAFDW